MTDRNRPCRPAFSRRLGRERASDEGSSLSAALDASAVRQLSAFLACTPDYVLVFTTPSGVIERWVGAAERVMGYTASEAVGQSLSILFTLEDRQRGLDQHEISVARLQGRSEDDRWHVRKDGSRFWASGVLTAIKDEDDNVVGLCKLLRDKTDVRMRLQLLEDKLGGRDAEIERQQNFLTATAHELRNPLMPIVSALALLSRPDGATMAAKATKILENQVAVLTALIDDLANVGKAGQVGAPLPLQRQSVSLNEALRVVTDGFQPRAMDEGKTLLLVLPASEICVNADAARLQQMLLNLLGNAFKYTRPGGLIGVSASIEGGMAIVRIEDDGLGIPADVLPHIFELFTREKRQDEIAGLGVGLAVVKELAELHGGNIEARSQGQDKGCVFGLRLPLAVG